MSEAMKRNCWRAFNIIAAIGAGWAAWNQFAGTPDRLEQIFAGLVLSLTALRWVTEEEI